MAVAEKESAEGALEKRTILDRVSGAVLEAVSAVPGTMEPRSERPAERGQEIAAVAAVKSAMVSGGLALPAGPLGLVTIVPDLVAIWRIQSQMVADIAGAYGKTSFLTREQMMYCLFRHAASQMVRDLVVRMGERLLIRRLPLSVIQKIVRGIGVKMTQRFAGRAVSRFLPVVGAVGVGAYAYFDTKHVGKTAMEFFGSRIEVERVEEAARESGDKPPRHQDTKDDDGG